MKESFLLDSGTWSIGDKPEQADYDGLVHVLEDGVWEIEDNTKTTGPSRMVNPSGGNSNEQNTQ